MKRNCPVTGDAAEIVESTGQVVVKHRKLGRYLLDTNAVPALAARAEARTRIARWIEEFRSLGIGIPRLTREHVHFFQRLTDLEARISEWLEWRQTIKQVDEERLWRKLRLEWNYNSNHIEGNTLTYHETELLLIHGRTAGGHPLRDYEEMKAHNVAIDHTRRLGNSESILGEVDIRDLNTILLKEPFWQSAKTLGGRATRKRIIPGQYKTQPNHVRTATGELHRFAEPQETPALMAEWIRDFRRDLARNAYPLPLFLAESHWSFLRIHPFDDGNGRTARLLANYALLRNNLPPIVIKSEDRDRYIGALQNADLGRMLPLARFMLENLSWSLALAVRAAKGESIRESDDISKEMELFVRSKRGPGPNKSDLEVLDNVFLMHVRPTLDILENHIEPLSQLFRSYSAISYIEIVHYKVTPSDLHIGNEHHGVNSSELFKDWEQTKQAHIVTPGFALSDERKIGLKRKYQFGDYRGSGNRGFGLSLSVVWILGQDRFSLEVEIDGKRLTAVGHSIPYSELDGRGAEVDRTVEAICRFMMNEIASRSQVST